MTKYCTDCKFFEPNNEYEPGNISAQKFAHCLKAPDETAGSYHLITKMLLQKYHYCNTVRSCAHLCGAEGQWFEEKQNDQQQ